MSILVDEKNLVLVQGITGKEGGRAANEMIGYGTKVVAGVTPGKGGGKHESGVPIFNTVAEALKAFPKISTSMVAVPPAFAADAILESLEAGIKLINVLTEKIPVSDIALLIAAAKQHGAIVVGPSSVGIISPGKAKLGSIGSSGLSSKIFMPGKVGVISKSGGMTAEISRILTDAGIGQSTVLGIGGDPLVCSDFADIALLFEKDSGTKALVIFGEIGGSYEEKLAEAIIAKKITKPVIALIVGEFTENLKQGTVLGHAGAIVSRGKGSFSSKVAALKKAGVRIAKTPEEIPLLLMKAMK
jgi:succinyl-CoA synthetase alpha subunit